jgi:hypothetical protein
MCTTSTRHRKLQPKSAHVQVNPLVPPWGVPGELACSTPARAAPTTKGTQQRLQRPVNADEGDSEISMPFNVQHIASGAAFAQGVGGRGLAASGGWVGKGFERGGEDGRTAGESRNGGGGGGVREGGEGGPGGGGSHYQKIETQVLRQVTTLHDLSDKDLEEWRDR